MHALPPAVDARTRAERVKRRRTGAAAAVEVATAHAAVAEAAPCAEVGTGAVAGASIDYGGSEILTLDKYAARTRTTEVGRGAEDTGEVAKEEAAEATVENDTANATASKEAAAEPAEARAGREEVAETEAAMAVEGASGCDKRKASTWEAHSDEAYSGRWAQEQRALGRSVHASAQFAPRAAEKRVSLETHGLQKRQASEADEECELEARVSYQSKRSVPFRDLPFKKRRSLLADDRASKSGPTRMPHNAGSSGATELIPQMAAQAAKNPRIASEAPQAQHQELTPWHGAWQPGPGALCEFCGNSFSTSCSKEDHITKWHLKPWPWHTCKLTGCGKIFHYRKELRAHGKRDHTPIPLTCMHPDCGKVFDNLTELSDHGRLHIALPLACPFQGCDTRFVTQADQKEHVRQHSMRDPHACSWPECDVVPTSYRALVLHYRSHTGYMSNTGPP